jgi:hypothetical protein
MHILRASHPPGMIDRRTTDESGQRFMALCRSDVIRDRTVAAMQGRDSRRSHNAMATETDR